MLLARELFMNMMHDCKIAHSFMDGMVEIVYTTCVLFRRKLLKRGTVMQFYNSGQSCTRD